jgi:hypothetical protein
MQMFLPNREVGKSSHWPAGHAQILRLNPNKNDADQIMATAGVPRLSEAARIRQQSISQGHAC